MKTIKLIQTIGLSSLLTLTALSSIPASVKASEKNQPSIGLKQNFGQSVIYINPRQGTDSPGAGSSLERPYRSISYALKSATVGTEIRLTEGEYVNEQFPLVIPDGVKLTGNASQKGSNTIISGGGDYLTKTFGLQNVTIVAGDNSELIGISVTNPNNRGTGIWIENARSVVSDSSFINNNREGIFVTGTSSPIIKDSLFRNNTGNGIGFGRQAKGEVRRNTFDNTGFALSMGGDSAPFVTQNTIINNNSGIVLTENSKPILQGNTIQNNRDYGIIATSKANPQVQDGNNFVSNGNDMYIALAKGSTPVPVATKPVETLPPPTDNTSSTITAVNSTTYSDKVSFECAQVKGGYVTMVQRDNAAVLPRVMINWTRQVGPEYTPERRCQIVTDNLNRVVNGNGGRIDNLSFIVGKVRGSSVVCLVNTGSLGCNESNILFTLSARNANNPREVINSLASNIGSSASGTGSPVQESASGPFTSLAPLNESLQPEAALWFANN
jgi:parallel beta-helix repeat protein